MTVDEMKETPGARAVAAIAVEARGSQRVQASASAAMRSAREARALEIERARVARDRSRSDPGASRAAPRRRASPKRARERAHHGLVDLVAARADVRTDHGDARSATSGAIARERRDASPRARPPRVRASPRARPRRRPDGAAISTGTQSAVTTPIGEARHVADDRVGLAERRVRSAASRAATARPCTCSARTSPRGASQPRMPKPCATPRARAADVGASSRSRAPSRRASAARRAAQVRRAAAPRSAAARRSSGA